MNPTCPVHIASLLSLNRRDRYVNFYLFPVQKLKWFLRSLPLFLSSRMPLCFVDHHFVIITLLYSSFDTLLFDPYIRRSLDALIHCMFALNGGRGHFKDFSNQT